MTTLYDIPVRTIDGHEQTLAPFQGKVLLIVNTASACGLTPQYAGLEAPGSAAEIKAFCSLNYDVSFPMFAKIDVNGDETHPLYRHLKAAQPGLLGTEAIKWNFTKFLVGRDGTVLKRYAPTDPPDAIRADMETALG